MEFPYIEIINNSEKYIEMLKQKDIIYITPTGKKNETNFFNSDVKAHLKGLFPFDRTYRLETFVLQ